MKAFLLTLLPLVALSCSEKGGEPVTLVPSDTAVVQVLALARVEPSGGIIELASPVQGVLAVQLVAEGATVERGQVIARLEDAAQLAELAQAEARSTERSASVRVIEAQLATSKADLEQARTAEQRSSTLFEKGGVTGQDREEAVIKAQNAQRMVEQRIAELHQALAREQEGHQDIARLHALRDQRQIKAPLNGTLLAFSAQPGEAVNVGGVIGEFAPDTSLIARAEVDELHANRLKLGSLAVIRSQLTGDTMATGRIERLGQQLKRRSIFSDEGDTEDRRVREVIITLEPRTLLLLGAKVEMLISVAP